MEDGERTMTVPAEIRTNEDFAKAMKSVAEPSLVKQFLLERECGLEDYVATSFYAFARRVRRDVKRLMEDAVAKELDKVTDIKCPLCKGQGNLPKPKGKHGRRIIDNTIMAKLLRKEGYSLREIGAFLGYKSPRSVELCLARKP
jgi:hypothetical protein